MKFSAKLMIFFFVALMAFCSCNSGPKFSSVTGKEWQLVEVQSKSGDFAFDRQKLNSQGFGNIFTLNFDAESLSGVGAPNRYTAPYKLEKNQVINVQLVAGTLMAPIREPEKLKEQEYFTYIQNAYKWNFTKEGLFELYSKNAEGMEAVLVYKLGTAGK